MKSGIKCDKVLIKGNFHPSSNGVEFAAKDSIILQFVYKKDVDLPEAQNLVKELQESIGANIKNESDMMTDYVDIDRICFHSDNAFYNDIKAVIKQEAIKDTLKEIVKAEKALNAGNYSPDDQKYYQWLLNTNTAKLAKLTA